MQLAIQAPVDRGNNFLHVSIINDRYRLYKIIIACFHFFLLFFAAADLYREFTYPSVVDDQGKHLSYDITAAAASHRHRRNSQADTRTYFKINAFGESLILNVSLYTDFIHTDSATVEYMQANGNSTVHTSMQSACHHVGHVQSVRDLIGGENVAGGDDGQWVSVSSCKGLVRVHVVYAHT